MREDAKGFPRRTVLRSLGASIALPLLEAMEPPHLARGCQHTGRSPAAPWPFCTYPTAFTCPTGRRSRLGPTSSFP